MWSSTDAEGLRVAELESNNRTASALQTPKSPLAHLPARGFTVRRRQDPRAVAEWRRARILAGLCPDCRSPAAGDGTQRCQSCKERAASDARTRAAKRKAEGLCTKCGRPAKPGYTLCADCLRKRNDHRARRRAEGLCSCGEPPIPGLKQCAKCRQRNNERKDRQKAAGRCAHCPRKARPGRRTCVRCGDRLRMHAKAVYHRARAERERRAANTGGAGPATQARDPHHRRGPVAGDGA